MLHALAATSAILATIASIYLTDTLCRLFARDDEMAEAFGDWPHSNDSGFVHGSES